MDNIYRNHLTKQRNSKVEVSRIELTIAQPELNPSLFVDFIDEPAFF